MLMGLRSQTPEEAPPVLPRSCLVRHRKPSPHLLYHPKSHTTKLPARYFHPISIPTTFLPARPSSPLVDLIPSEITPTTSTFSISHADLLSLD